MKKISTILFVVVFLLTSTLSAQFYSGKKKSKGGGSRNYTQQVRNYMNKVRGDVVYVNERKGFIAIFADKAPIGSVKTSENWSNEVSCLEMLGSKNEQEILKSVKTFTIKGVSADLEPEKKLKCLIGIEFQKGKLVNIRLTNLASIKTFMDGKKNAEKMTNLKGWIQSELNLTEVPLYTRLTKGGYSKKLIGVEDDGEKRIFSSTKEMSEADGDWSFVEYAYTGVREDSIVRYMAGAQISANMPSVDTSSSNSSVGWIYILLIVLFVVGMFGLYILLMKLGGVITAYNNEEDVEMNPETWIKWVVRILIPMMGVMFLFLPPTISGFIPMTLSVFLFGIILLLKKVWKIS